MTIHQIRRGALDELSIICNKELFACCHGLKKISRHLFSPHYPTGNRCPVRVLRRSSNSCGQPTMLGVPKLGTRPLREAILQRRVRRRAARLDHTGLCGSEWESGRLTFFAILFPRGICCSILSSRMRWLSRVNVTRICGEKGPHFLDSFTLDGALGFHLFAPLYKILILLHI